MLAPEKKVVHELVNADYDQAVIVGMTAFVDDDIMEKCFYKGIV